MNIKRKLFEMTEIDDVIKEVELVEMRYGEYRSSHEGYSIILEEVDELWEEVKKRSPDYQSQYLEAKHVACTAIRYMKMCKRYNSEIGKR